MQDEHGQNQQQSGIPHTQVHHFLRRTLETAQDGIVVILLVMLLAVTVQALWKLAQMIFESTTSYSTVLSQVVFVLILAELYRTLIFYLREHRVSVTLIVEVAIVSTLQELILKSADHFDAARVYSSAVLLLVLGTLLAMERYFSRLNDTSDTSAH